MKKISAILIFVLIFSIFSVSAFAQSTEYTADIKSCANMGNWQEYAENSLEAIEACDTDYISVDVKLTKDSVPVLMKDDTLERMCVDANGNTVTGAVKDKTYQEISSYFLRYADGGELAKKSEFTVPSLENALGKINKNTILIIDTNSNDLDTVYAVVSDSEKSNQVLFRLEDCDSKDILSIVKENEKFKNLLIPEYNGNIIFGATALLKNAKEAELNIVKLGTKNVNGVVLYDSFTDKFRENSTMAMFSMVDEYCAERTDDVTGWDNVISHGYSIIETDYPDMLEQYIADTEALRSDLKSLVEACKEHFDGKYSSDSLNNLTDAYEFALSCVEGVASRTEISNAFYSLSEAYNELEPATENETIGKFTFSFGRVIAVVLCGGAIIAGQVYLFKKRK